MAQRRKDKTARLLGGITGVVVVAGVGLITALQLTSESSDTRSLVAFGLSVVLLVGLGGVMLGLLRRVGAERRLADAERRLNRASVDEQTSARQRAEQAEAVSRNLIQLLGREIRGPLASIRGFAREVVEREQLPEEQRHEFFTVIRRQSTRLMRVIEDLMLAARLAAGDTHTEGFVPVDIASLVRDTVGEVEAPPTHRVMTIVGDELPRVRGEPAELRQALLALIENAIRYSPAGGTVEVVTLPAADGVEISVSDEGVGVPEELHNRMFELLATGEDDDHIGEAGGIGVGLFLARAVAARCEGEVRMESRAGLGSVFTLFLPGIPGEEHPE